MRNFCPRGRMSSIGRYQRNVLTYKQVKVKRPSCIISYFMLTFVVYLRSETSVGSPLVFLWHRWHLSPGSLGRRYRCQIQIQMQMQIQIQIKIQIQMSDICLQVLFISHKEEWGSETIFWIWNIKGFVANEGLHIFIPFILSVPKTQETVQALTSMFTNRPC